MAWSLIGMPDFLLWTARHLTCLKDVRNWRMVKRLGESSKKFDRSH